MTIAMSTLRIAPLALALLAGSTAIGLAQTVRDLSVEQTQVFNAGAVKPGSLSVMTLLDRADATYAVGEAVRLAIKANEDAYVTVLNIGASGKVTQLFPNAAQSDNKVKAGETVEIPSAASGAQIRVGGPVGAELIKVIATSKPVTVIADGQWKQGSGLFRSLEGDAGTLQRDLEVVATKPPAETKIAIVNQVIKTIAAREASAAPAPAPAATVLVVPAAPAPASTRTFPLLLATDKTTYRVGETITLSVTPTQACHLTVSSTGAKGTQVLFPSVALPEAKVAAGQAVMVSGGSAQSVVAGAPGAQVITALCTTEARPHTIALKAAADEASAEDKAALERDLTVVASKPAGTVGLAQTTLTIVP